MRKRNKSGVRKSVHHGGKAMSDIRMKKPPSRTPPKVPGGLKKAKSLPNKQQQRRKKKFTSKDFKVIKELGEGAFSKVYLTMLKETQELFATKKIQKELLIKNKQVKTVKMEKTVLSMLNHPNIIKLFCSYQDETHLYFVLELARGGELFDKIRKYGRILPKAVKFYAAEIVLGLEYMHSQKVIHRDMKPENIIFDKSMHLKITDFGTAKIKDYGGKGKDLAVVPDSKHKETFCGTAQYVSPEIINGKPCNAGSDLWALGCIIYQMVTTRPPFQAKSNYLIFNKIKERKFEFPKNMDKITKDIIKRLLVLEPSKRLGVKSYDQLKSHPFFSGIDWENIHEQTPPPMVPPELKKKIDAEIKKKKEEEEKKKSMARRKAALEKVGKFTDLVPKEKDFSKFTQYINRGEKIIYCGDVMKKTRITAKLRTLILTTRPRFIYLDPLKEEIRGTIDWELDLSSYLVNEKRFEVRISGRTYVFDDVNFSPDKWVNCITKVRDIYKGLDRLGALD